MISVTNSYLIVCLLGKIQYAIQETLEMRTTCCFNVWENRNIRDRGKDGNPISFYFYHSRKPSQAVFCLCQLCFERNDMCMHHSIDKRETIRNDFTMTRSPPLLVQSSRIQTEWNWQRRERIRKISLSRIETRTPAWLDSIYFLNSKDIILLII
jgi:hypothetical protein